MSGSQRIARWALAVGMVGLWLGITRAATSGAEHVFHAAISARTGKLASAHHPPALASVASKIKRLWAR